MSAMICIDFGNTFTKVGVRKSSDCPTELFRDGSLEFYDPPICVPTLAAEYRANGSAAWDYGMDVMRHPPSEPGLRVYRNWKPQFFRGYERPLRRTSPEPASVSSTRAHPAHARRRLTDEQWRRIREETGLPDAAREAIEAVMQNQPSEGGQESAPPAETGLEVREIGLGFFSWLRGFIEPYCKRLGLGPVSDIPVRITLPSFGARTGAEDLLTEILEETGWRPDPRVPALAEPLANAIGTFSEGLNVTHEPRPGVLSPHYGKMFAQTGLLQAIRRAILADGPKFAWVMIADLGGYTADFAMIGLDLTDIDSKLEGEEDGKPRLATHSEAIGVTTLDSRVWDLFGEDVRRALNELSLDPDQRRLETFHRAVYGGRRSRYVLRNVTLGARGEMGAIRECIDRFGEEIADYAERFLEMYQYDRIDDLILTGGGMMIPAVREALRSRLLRYGVQQTHMFSEAQEQLPDHCHRLDPSLVRGATALGGASVYFDFAD